MQHWIFPLEGDVGLWMEPWAFEKLGASDRIFWVERSGEIAFGGEVVAKEADVAAGSGGWIAARYERVRVAIAAAEARKVVREQPADLDAGPDPGVADALREWPCRKTLEARGGTAERLVALAGTERAGWVKRRLPWAKDPTESRLWILPLDERTAEKVGAAAATGEIWLEAGEVLFEQLREESRVLLVDPAGTATDGGRVLARVRREGDPGGSLRVERWRLTRPIPAAGLEGQGDPIEGERLFTSARRVAGEPAQELLEASRPADGGLTAWLVPVPESSEIHLAPDNRVLLTIRHGARIYFQEASGDIESWGTVVDTSGDFRTDEGFYPLVAVRRRRRIAKVSVKEVRERALRVWLRRFRPTADPLTVWPEPSEAAAEMADCWIFQREGAVAVEVDDETFDRIEVGDPVLRAEVAGHADLAGVVLGKEGREGQEGPRLRVDLTALEAELPDELRAALESFVPRPPHRAIPIEVAPEPLTELFAPMLERLRRRGSPSRTAPGSPLARVWLLPGGPVELDLEDTRIALDDPVLWQESRGEIRSWGRVLDVGRGARVERLALEEPIAPETVEKVFEPPEPRQLRDPDEVAAFFDLTRETPRSFEEAFREEMDAITRLRERRGHQHAMRTSGNVVVQADRAQLAGLAFSGGGIRSATFNLGILQGLAGMDLLRGFDYLSTVSGGGYIGSWLVAWIRRQGRERVEATLQKERAPRAAGRRPAAEHHGSPIAWLRAYSNFLTPNLGMFTADTWTAGATYLRNLLLNLMVLATFLATYLLVPRIVVQGSSDLGYAAGGWLFWLALALQAVGLFFVGKNAAALTDFLDPAAARAAPRRGDEGVEEPMTTDEVLVRTVAPLFASNWAAALWVWLSQEVFGWRMPLPGWISGRVSELGVVAWLGEREWLVWMLTIAALYTLVWLFYSVREESWTWSKVGHPLLLKAFPAGLGGGLAIWLLTRVLHSWTSGDFALAVVWGPPLITLGTVVTAVLHVGFMGRHFPEDQREWWSRLGAWMGIASVGWIVAFSLALYGPVALAWLKAAGPTWVSGVSLGWLVTTVGGIWAARRSGEQGSAYELPLKLLATVAPYVFAVGLLALLALAIQAAAAALLGSGGQAESEAFSAILDHQLEATWQNTGTNLFLLLALLIGLRLVSKKLSTWVDVNEFSMHLFYRNRLVRAFLGASNETRSEHPFIGFDPDDDLALDEVLPAPTAASHPAGYDGPYPILNATLNLAGSGELAWQQRKARSFFFAPLHYGFDTGREDADGPSGPTPRAGLESFAIRCTAARRSVPQGKSITLGTAATVSGAAVSSGMGSYSSPALAFLMTVFNARLGLWLGNPKHSRTWSEPGPEEGLEYLVRELFGRTTEEAEYVSLSDGGHFENLGIYELVRRRCRFIVACDAEGDPGFEFKGLGEAIRKCRIDFGVEIDLDVEPLRPAADGGLSRWHCAYGDIVYPEPLAPRGTLIYLKASLTGDEPEDLINYRATRPGFPHESTGDQWFDESQFESYRQLGQHVARKVFGVADTERARGRIEPVIVDLRQNWYPPSAAVSKSFTRNTELLVQIFERLRGQKNLRFLIPQVYTELAAWEGGRPVWEADATGKRRRREWHPARPEQLSRDEFREGFFLCNSVIQLMENVYVDLSLEREWEHPDNRGWMNLFKHWAWSWMFRLTWAVSASTYGSRFQRFCERRLRLDTGKVRAERIASYDEFPPKRLGPEADHEYLNADERRLRRAIDRAVAGRSLPGHAPTTLWSIRLHVGEPDEFAEGASPAADGTGGREALFEFSIGLAMLRGHRRHDPSAEPNRGLVFLRIRSHLRNLGLGRRALEHLVRHEGLGLPLLLPDKESLAAISPRLVRAGVEERLREMLFSVTSEVGRRSG